MAEIWDAYNRQFQKIENVELVRGEAVPDGMFHLVGEIIVKHLDGTYLLMQRDMRKHLGGRWELTAGGSALRGENPLECAIRELREETGIHSSKLTEVKRIVHETHHTLYVEFLCCTECDKNSIVLQDDETIAYKWVDKQTILNMDMDELASSRAIEILKSMAE